MTKTQVMPREKDFSKDSVTKKCISLFASNGYNATGIQQIVDATGINRSSLYSTYKGKDNLFHVCLQVAAREEKEMLEGLLTQASGLKFIDAYLAEISKDKPVYHLFKFANAEFRSLNKKSQTVLTSHLKWKFDFLLDIVEKGQSASRISRKMEASDIVALLELVTQGAQNLSGNKSYTSAIPNLTLLMRKKHK